MKAPGRPDDRRVEADPGIRTLRPRPGGRPVTGADPAATDTGHQMTSKALRDGFGKVARKSRALGDMGSTAGRVKRRVPVVSGLPLTAGVGRR